MTHIELKERVSRAMRAMNKEPSAFLFIDGNTDWTCDLPEICGIPVFHGIDLRCYYADAYSEECPIVPLGRTDNEIDFRDRKCFAEAWSE